MTSGAGATRRDVEATGQRAFVLQLSQRDAGSISCRKGENRRRTRRTYSAARAWSLSWDSASGSLKL